MTELTFTAANTVKVKVLEVRSAISWVHSCISSVRGCRPNEVENELKVLVRSCNRLITLTGRMSEHDKERKMEAIMCCQKMINDKR